jgi:hypothetical protein
VTALMPPMPQPLERLSIELHDRCGKACWFCYNGSNPAGEGAWNPDDVIAFVDDCARHGVQAVSFGGGEPHEYPALFDVLSALRGRLYRSITSNGLLLEEHLSRLIASAPERVHLSIHFPGNALEVARVVRQVESLAAAGIPSGINLLVQASRLAEATACAHFLRAAGLGNDRIIYLPMRGRDTPTPTQLAAVAGNLPFQSMTCLSACGPSPRFASLDSHGRIAWCSYTRSRHPLRSFTHAGLLEAMQELGLAYCGDPDPQADLVVLRRREAAPSPAR